MAPIGGGGRSRVQGEDSDVIAGLIRTAFIVAFWYASYHASYYGSYVTGPSWHTPRYMTGLLVTAFLVNLGLFYCYLRGYRLTASRLPALAIDLLLVTAAIAAVAEGGYYEIGRDLFGLYYLVVITAAIWFRRTGAVVVALAAIGLTVATSPALHSQYVLRDLAMENAPRTLLLLVAIVAGYLMRARDAEHRASVELQQELRLARALQSAMLPARLPEAPGYDIGLTFQPARQVGGDFYGVRLLDEDRLLIVLADMAGKSVYGLVHLSLVHSHLQAAADGLTSVAAIAEDVNRHTYASLQPDTYAALFVGILRLSDGTLSFVNCGHVPPLRVPPGGAGAPEQLSTGGIVIGAVPDPGYVEHTVVMQPGDVLVCYSDGVSEARNRRREQFGEQRVEAAALGSVTQSAQAIGDGILRQAQAFAAVGQDDVTILVVKRQGPGDAGATV